ncbi:homocitrate synthase [Tepidanaerobacter syntrophicus]|uniref:Homocitrate synthase NifV n=1 Tax=Tepidanaerobacter syntrophicus TaxID=224999 RepID=A0A0U9HKY4_9FIRM|nr:homocitrate synthase [Tepidanaerobacter syntrophicus]GAQ24735.1 homocitrate synthase NifV [Tepidanaerobacter syntrophicus]GLI18996.1 homocitrate synthase [Tepidanaerobacter syntrophicus]GLI51130.1 homocitrate synthase [Tepidanaerobacter syntrophicus]
MTEKDRKIYIVDTTLRDGEQTAGVVFANREKIQIAKMLDEIGVDEIEAGTPVMGGDEKEAITAIAKLGLNARIMAWNRAVIKDIQESLRCGVGAVAISIATSDMHIKDKLHSTREEVLEKMVKAVEYAKKEGVYVSANAEDASRSDEEYLIQFIKAAKQAGADRIRYCDTVGIMTPLEIYERIKRIRQAVDIDIEMHTHDDFGMATANAITGVSAGATHVGVTVNGLGERAGNAALEEVVMALKHLLGFDMKQNTRKFREICEYVAKASGRDLPSWKAIVGTSIFTHESGIHADGAIKNPKTYEVFDPDDVGLTRRFVIGKHSGTASIKKKLSEYNINIDDGLANIILESVRKTSVELKRPLTDAELLNLYYEHVNKDIEHAI